MSYKRCGFVLGLARTQYPQDTLAGSAGQADGAEYNVGVSVERVSYGPSRLDTSPPARLSTAYFERFTSGGQTGADRAALDW